MRASLTLFALLSACSAFAGDDGGPPGGNDAGATCDHPCGANESCRAGQCQPGCPEGIIYVASGGSDTNRGCMPNEPKQTIGSAIAYVKTLGATNHEIHVCRGSYLEPGLTLDYPVSLRGGYECAVWTRTEHFGWPGWDSTSDRAKPFDQTNETIILAGGPTALDVRGAAITRAVAIDGFTIRGRDADGGVALSIREGASPTVSVSTIIGASGTIPTTDPSSTAVDIADNSAPEIIKCRIDGGGGQATAGQAFGSCGLYLHTAGAPVIHDNEIDGGHGSSPAAAAAAVHVGPPTVLSGDSAFTHNHLFYMGNGAKGAVFAAFGVVVASGAQADIVENDAIGGALGCAEGTCTSVGMFVAGAKSRLMRNRVFGGTNGSAAPPVLLGISVLENVDDVDVLDNIVDLGLSVANQAVGIEARPDGARRRIVNNTVYGHSVPGTYGVRSYGTESIVDNNLITALGVGFTTGDCTGGLNLRPPTSLRNNAFVLIDLVASKSTGTCDTTEAANDVSDIDSVLPGVTGANVQLAPACTGRSSDVCRTCSDAKQCISSVFAGTLDLADLIANDAKLRDDAPCLIAKGAADRTSFVPVDAENKVRAAPFTIGALELDDTCTP